ATANVITAADIKAMGVTDFSQVMAMIPGVHIYLDPVTRLDAQFSMRGIHTSDNSQVLVLVNGHDITNVSTGSTPFGFRLPVANIARVEVMRSPGSALYGADAFAGVINIITKEASEIAGTDIGWRQGSFNTQDIWLRHGTSLNDEWDLAFSLETSRSDGDDGRIVEYNNEDLLARTPPGPRIAGSGSLETNYDYTNMQMALSSVDWQIRLWNWDLKRAGNGQGAAQIVDPEGFTDSELYLFDIQHENRNLLPDWDVNSRLSYELNEGDTRFVLYPPNTVGKPGGTQRKGTFSLRSHYSGFDNHSLLLGVGTERVLVKPREARNFNTASPTGVMVDVT
ncbi:MAG: TonB-dependent receptor plug domain-containing protein, partial [Candidatus Marinimicrobia bacterium]|nr:TonB-dependent receptor plug domain-containing protein [Candidatus Neomarinimicrobiota bacterium]